MWIRCLGVCFLAIAMVFCSPLAFAGKVELTTYYPAPYGEYKELKSTENASFATDTTKNGKVGIGTTTPQAILDVRSTTSGFLPPRMTTAERNAIDSTLETLEGSVIYNTDSDRLEVLSNGVWGPTRVFGAWSTKQHNTTYQADADGFAVFYCQAGSDCLVQGRTSGIQSEVEISSPWIPNGSIRQQSDARVVGGVPSGASGMMPVRKGDYWYIYGQGSATGGMGGSSPSFVVYWIPLE